jgi:hypothetical protein
VEYEFELSDAEFRRAWLAEYFRRSALARLRAVAGPLIALVGAHWVRAGDHGLRVFGGLAILFGLWHIAKPFLVAEAWVRRRRMRGAASATIRVRIDGEGIRVSDGAKETRYGWNRVRAAGRGRDYVWFEVAGGARATIPLRAVPDEPALVAVLRRHTRWT